ncbi:MAG: 1-deoxy-D-xylulose-5-phosphate synthase N-terminal domain-containing protein [Herpetosiphon sp.]
MVATNLKTDDSQALLAKAGSASGITATELEILETIQQRMLWLATLIVHEANTRPNVDGTKVGGHQASSASVVSILTALYFHYLNAGDRVAIKPHASPVFHAAQYLLGNLPAEYLSQLRSYGGLQAYPSRTKDPDPVDFSTGSVGLGAVAPAFAALVDRYTQSHFGVTERRRFVALIGDAELDEGSIWEAAQDEALTGLDNLLWIVDLNRQSLDRIVPGIRAAQLKRIFAASGWSVLEAKYGRRLQAVFAKSGGERLRARIDTMSNEEYQALIRLPGDQLRARLAGSGAQGTAIKKVLKGTSDEELPSLLANLGGHDLAELLDVFKQADTTPGKPTVLFAYTVKGWGLPIAGHPLNHSMLLNSQQMKEVQESLGIKEGKEWERFDPASPEGVFCGEAARRLYPTDPTRPTVMDKQQVPAEIKAPVPTTTSSQEAFGRVLVSLADHKELRPRIVTTSPDVSVSTNLAGWINKTGVFSRQEEPDYEEEQLRLLNWKQGPSGQHIELGISEMNLFMLLSMLGVSAELSDQFLIPIGTVYDPFVCRGLDALIYGLYMGSKFIFAGTPSGISLSPEGGAHQSTVTPSLGMELPNLHAYEPCFAQEVEWIMMQAIRECCDREKGRSTYLRLSTRPVTQALLQPARRRLSQEILQQQVLAGGYRLVDWRDVQTPVDEEYVVQIAATGAMVPEAVAAARALHEEGVAANVLNITSGRRLYESWQQWQRRGVSNDRTAALDWLIPANERHAPLVTVQDGASHTLSWLAAVHGAPLTALGVDDFGQSGTRNDLYHHFGIDPDGIVAAVYAAFAQQGR